MSLLVTVAGTKVYQDIAWWPPGDSAPVNRVSYIADLDVDGDGARKTYRLDNNRDLALDDIHASAGWPHEDWENVLVPDPRDPSRPYVDDDGYCVSMTSYQWTEFPKWDRRRYVDAASVPYSVAPGFVRKLCRGVLLGSLARITDLVNGKKVDCVTADFSGNTTGEASIAAAVFFNPDLSPRNADERKRYLYEFFPGTPAVINGVTYRLIPMGA